MRCRIANRIVIVVARDNLYMPDNFCPLQVPVSDLLLCLTWWTIPGTNNRCNWRSNRHMHPFMWVILLFKLWPWYDWWDFSYQSGRGCKFTWGLSQLNKRGKAIENNKNINAIEAASSPCETNKSFDAYTYAHIFIVFQFFFPGLCHHSTLYCLTRASVNSLCMWHIHVTCIHMQ